MTALAGVQHQLGAAGQEDTQAPGRVGHVVVVVSRAVLGVEADGPAGLLAGERVGEDLQHVVTVGVALVGQAAGAVGDTLRDAVRAGAGGEAGGEEEADRLEGRASGAVVGEYCTLVSSRVVVAGLSAGLHTVRDGPVQQVGLGQVTGLTLSVAGGELCQH